MSVKVLFNYFSFLHTNKLKLLLSSLCAWDHLPSYSLFFCHFSKCCHFQSSGFFWLSFSENNNNIVLVSFLEWFSHFKFHPKISKFKPFCLTIAFTRLLPLRTCEFFFVSLARAELWLLLNGLLILCILCFTSSMRQVFTPRMNSKWQFLPLFNILPFLEYQAFFIDKLLRCWCRVVFGIFLSILKFSPEKTHFWLFCLLIASSKFQFCHCSRSCHFF